MKGKKFVMKKECIRIKAIIAKFLLAVMVVCASAGFVNPSNVKAANETLMNTYGNTYGYSGTCINLYQLKDQATLNQVKKHYNSVTLENEMKPDALLGGSANLMSVNDAEKQGYYIPSNYKESTVPRINFNTVDQALKICKDNGLKMRAHTLVWHSQTPSWFFRWGYNGGSGFVNSSTMDARMEMYIKTVMNHVYTGQYKDVVYCWDVVNEYFHATDSGWEAVYGKCGNKPAFVKRAFQYAYDTISYFKLQDKVSLFYNDFNTYMEVDDVITMIKYINAEKKICSGVGMQSHLGTTFPTVDYYTTALRSFCNAGFEVQITEIDVTNKNDEDQKNYMYQLFKNINNTKKNGGKITGITHWGISDKVTWIKNARPLLFSDTYTAKSAYYAVIQAHKDVFGTATNNNNNNNTNNNTNTQVKGSYIPNGWYYIKNVNAQKYLQVTGNKGGNGVNVEIGKGTGVKGQKWYVTNTSDGYITLKNGNGYMLDVVYGKADKGTNIQTYSDNGADAQRFKAVSVSNGVYGIVTKVSKDELGLDDYNWSKEDGTNVIEWTYTGAANQQWIFERCN